MSVAGACALVAGLFALPVVGGEKFDQITKKAPDAKTTV
jgi:hypothetical protein